jgi:hypothetical protein
MGFSGTLKCDVPFWWWFDDPWVHPASRTPVVLGPLLRCAGTLRLWTPRKWPGIAMHNHCSHEISSSTSRSFCVSVSSPHGLPYLRHHVTLNFNAVMRVKHDYYVLDVWSKTLNSTHELRQNWRPAQKHVILKCLILSHKVNSYLYVCCLFYTVMA